MATITTTTQTDVVAPPGLPSFARDITNGYLYALVRTNTNTLTLYKSTDSGGTWNSYASFTHSTLGEWSSLVVDKNQYAHISYRISDGTEDIIYYRRIYLLSGSPSWSSGLRVSGTGTNGGTPGAAWQGTDLAVVRNANGSYAIVVVAARTNGTTNYGIWAHGVSIDSTHGIYLNNGIIIGNRGWNVPGTAPGRDGVTCEVEHNGDGYTSSTPHVWVTWGRTTLSMVKIAWVSSTVGWQGPVGQTDIRSGIPAQDFAQGRWDGVRWMMSVVSPDDSTMVRVYQRNQANTSTTSIDTPAHPQGVIRYLATNYKNQTKDVRVYAVGTSTAVLYYVDYSRSLATWGSWTQVSATAILGVNEFGPRRGGDSGNARLDVVTAHSGAPNTIVHTAQTSTSAPAIPEWDTSASPYFNGGAADVNASLTLDWTFTDADPADTQGSYALSRQIGAGALSYWNAGSSTWGGTEVQNSSATSAVTLASGWAAGTDANYTFKVKVWDSANTPSAAYSAGLVLIPSVKVNPTVTSPTAAQVINVSNLSASWTVSEQTARRIRLLTNPGGVVQYDSGFVATSATSFVIPLELATGTGWTFELTTRNLEGLSSTAQSVNFTVAYAAPPVMVSTFTPSASDGWIAVAPSSPAPVGAQPSILYADLYRRKNATPILNANPTFAGNVTGYTVNGTGGGTLTYSTSQFAPGSSPGSARFVPNGTGVTPYIESTPVTIDPTKWVTISALIRPDTANKPIFIMVNWYTAASSFISSSAQLVLSSPIATAWQFFTMTVDASVIANVGKASVCAGLTSTPAGTDAVYIDEMRLRTENTSAAVHPVVAGSATATFNDSGVTSDVDYEYQWVVTGSNGTSLAGPWMS